MGILALSADERVADVTVAEDVISVRMKDGRTISVPIVWYPRLFNATEAQRKNWTISGGGFGIHWPDIDEDLSTEGLLRGTPAPALVKTQARASSKPEDQKTARELGASDKGIWDYCAEVEEASTKIVDLMLAFVRDAKTLSAKIDDHNTKLTKITKARGSAMQYRGLTLMFAADLNTFSSQIENVLPNINQAIESLESNFMHVVDFIDPTDPESAEIVSSLRSQLANLLSSVRGTKDSIATFRKIILQFQQKNLTTQLTNAAGRLLAAIDGFFGSYEDIESYGLKIAFRLDEKFGRAGAQS